MLRSRIRVEDWITRTATGNLMKKIIRFRSHSTDYAPIVSFTNVSCVQ